MKPVRALAIYLAAIFLGGALLAPWLYWLVQAGGPMLAHAAQKPFQRFVTNSFFIVALAGLWPFFRALGAKSAREIGLVNLAGNWRTIPSGVAIGLVSLAPVVVLAVLMGGRVWNTGLTAGRITEKIAGAILTAVGIGVLEEILFRGGVFGGLRRVFYWPFALVVSSLIFAATHFLADATFQGAVQWWSGLAVLPPMLGRFADWQAIVPGFLNLTLAGMLLGLAYQRTGNLYFSIGLHGGWIFWLAIYRVFTRTSPGANTWFWGTSNMIDGWLACLALSFTLALYFCLPTPRKAYSLA